MNVRQRARHRADAQRRARVEAGAVAVEFALILPFLVMLLLGVTTVGMAYNDKLAIANAAREGSRLGSAIDYSTGATTWADAVQTRVRQVYFNSGSTLGPDQVCVTLLDPNAAVALQVKATPTTGNTGCGAEPASPDSIPSGSCVVKVWVKKPARIDLGVFPPLSFDISARSVSIYGRTAGACTTP